ncbi:MAG: gas vesicle protein [Phycisphaerae bacterium]
MSLQQQQAMQHATPSATLADVLERVLDKGVVIAGDIKINLVDVELLTIRIRLMVASVDKAKEMGIDWWESDPNLQANPAADAGGNGDRVAELQERIETLEAAQPTRRKPPPRPKRATPEARPDA